MRRQAEALRAMAGRWIQELTIGAAIGIFACSTTTAPQPQPTSKVANVTARVAQTAAAMTGQTAKFANDYEKGRHLGFDTNHYPGDATMKAWKNEPGSPYKWVGFYLPDAPCHSDNSWSGKRDELVEMGWGVAVVYVGQQTWGETPRPLSPAQQEALRKRDECDADLLTAEEGRLNAEQATELARKEGFAKGIVIFLDIERMETIPDAMVKYYKAWTDRMLELGEYRPGIYAHQHNAAQIFGDVQGVFAARHVDEVPRFWIAGGKKFNEGRAPQDVGFAFAGVWQGLIDVARSVAEIKLPVDVNIAAWRSPSESGVTTE
jgi:hypothetical protein